MIDVSGWHAIAPEQEGRDEHKLWLSEEPGASRAQWWLWKPCKPTTGGQPRRSDIAEVMASHLAEAIGLPAAPAVHAQRDGVNGSISRNIAPVDSDLAPHVHEDDGYTVPLILDALDGVRGGPRCPTMTGAEVFTGFLVLDAWIANTDRHHKNWAVISPPGDELPYIAPSFDHGGALGAGLLDEARATQDVPRFCAKGRSNPFGRAYLLDLAADAVEITGATWWAERVAVVNPDLWTGILDEHAGLSHVARNFIANVLTENRERVSNACRR